MKRVALYGGSFDPIHNGHIEPVRQAVAELGLERVFYLPTAHPPHKSDRRFAAPLRRYAMTELALLGDPELVVSDFEIESGPSYTINTVEHFSALLSETRLYLMIGTDSLAQLEGWRRWSDLLERVHLAILRRPGWSRQDALAELSSATRERLDAAGARFIDNEPLDISATEIRRRLAAGEDLPDHWVPAAVLEYARKYGLYS